MRGHYVMVRNYTMVDLMKPVSGRQFAKMVGLSSDNSCRKAVERGSILRGYIKSEKKFIPKIAAQEWGKDILPEYLSVSEIAAQKKNAVKPQTKPRPKAPAKKQVEKTTADEIVNDILKEIPNKKNTGQVEAFFNDDDDELEDEEHPDGLISKPEAERRSAIHKSEILEIALAEKRGQMISIEKINSAFYKYGVEIRSALEAMPAQIIDKVRACETRHEALRVMDDAIFEVLNTLADIETRSL